MPPDDPLWKLRHALAGLALALVLALLAAAAAARVLGGLVQAGYSTRVALYCGLLLYAVIGAGVLFAAVAQHETQRVSVGRVMRWFMSLWLWPVLLATRRRVGK